MQQLAQIRTLTALHIHGAGRTGQAGLAALTALADLRALRLESLDASPTGILDFCGSEHISHDTDSNQHFLACILLEQAAFVQERVLEAPGTLRKPPFDFYISAGLLCLSRLCRLTQLLVNGSFCSADSAVMLALHLPSLATLGLALRSADLMNTSAATSILQSLSDLKLQTLTLDCHCLGWEADAISLPATLTVSSACDDANAALYTHIVFEEASLQAVSDASICHVLQAVTCNVEATAGQYDVRLLHLLLAKLPCLVQLTGCPTGCFMEHVAAGAVIDALQHLRLVGPLKTCAAGAALDAVAARLTHLRLRLGKLQAGEPTVRFVSQLRNCRELHLTEGTGAAWQLVSAAAGLPLLRDLTISGNSTAARVLHQLSGLSLLTHLSFELLTGLATPPPPDLLVGFSSLTHLQRLTLHFKRQGVCRASPLLCEDLQSLASLSDLSHLRLPAATKVHFLHAFRQSWCIPPATC